LPRSRYRTRASLGQEIGNLDLVILSDGTLDIVDADQLVLQRQQILQRFSNQLDGDLAPHEVRVSDDALKRTFQLTHVGADTLSDEERGVMRQVDLGLISLFHQDRYPGLQLRWFDRNGQPPAKTGLQALFQAIDLLGIAITGQ